jgi:hypothetical protein
MLHLQEPADEATFHFVQCRTNHRFFAVVFEEPILHRLMKVIEIRSGYGSTHGYEYLRSGFYQHSLIDGKVYRSTRSAIVSEDPRNKRSRTVEAVWQ